MNNNKYRILAVEDDSSVSSLLHAMLDAQHYETLMAETCAQGLMMLSSHVPDLVILDLGLPDRDGLEFIRTARQKSAVPILVLSARSTEKDKVTALDLGANDYITKPFSTAELLARIRAALRYSRPGAEQSKLPESRFQLHDLAIEYESRMVTVASQPIHLTQTEFNILALLAQHAGKLLRPSGAQRTLAATKSCRSIWRICGESWASGLATTGISSTNWASATACSRARTRKRNRKPKGFTPSRRFPSMLR